MTRADPQVKVRLPAELKAKIEATAAARKTSINAVVVDLLEKYDKAVEAAEIFRMQAESSKASSEIRLRQQKRWEDEAAAANQALQAQEARHREEIGALKAIRPELLDTLQHQLEVSAELHRRALQAARVTEGLLVSFVKRLYAALPQKRQEDYHLALRFASALESNEADELVGFFAELLKNDPKGLADLAKVEAEFRPALEAKRRGEDTTPYVQPYLRDVEQEVAARRAAGKTPKRKLSK